MIEAYPLHWPPLWPRTKIPQWSRFRTTMRKATQALLGELRRLGASQVIISTNIELRRDGLPYSNRRKPNDSGVAVYFKLKGVDQCFPCDKWRDIEDNIYSICKTVEALRGIERWGTGKMFEATFKGFKALPAHSDWRQVLNVEQSDDLENVERKFRRLALENHPDQGGNMDEWHKINKAVDEARQFFKPKQLTAPM